MKIKKISCPSCGYSFNLDNMDKNNVCECPACKSSLYIDEEKESPSIINININNYNSSGNNEHNESKINKRELKRKNEKSRASLILSIISAAAVLFIIMMASNKTSPMLPEYKIAISQKVEIPESEAVIRFCEEVFNKDRLDIRKNDYEKIAYLHIERDCPESDWSNADDYPWRFDYAFNVDANGAPIDKMSIRINAGTAIYKKDALAFKNLVNLGFGKYGTFKWNNSPYSFIYLDQLKKLRYYSGDDFENIAHSFADPSQIKYLHIDGISCDNLSPSDFEKFTSLHTLKVDYISEQSSLDNLANFKNLENLEIDYISTGKSCKIAFLSNLKKLKSLKLRLASDTNIDSSNTLYGLTNLEKLAIKNDKQIKNINFVKNMPNLYYFELSDSPILNLDALKDKLSISELYLEDLYAVRDISAISSLASLKCLKLVDLNGAKLDKLNNMKSLRYAHIDGDYLDELANTYSIADSLEELRLDTIKTSGQKKISSFKNLSKVELHITNTANEIIKEIPKLSKLKSLNIIHTDIIGHTDISPIFSSKSIEEMSINVHKILKPDLELNKDMLSENKTLKKLSMDELEIVDTKNDETGYLAICADEFLAKFTALEELSVKNNELQSLDFAKNMPNLRMLDISGNYITDISALLSCKKLDTLICTNNPIQNIKLLDENIRVEN